MIKQYASTLAEGFYSAKCIPAEYTLNYYVKASEDRVRKVQRGICLDKVVDDNSTYLNVLHHIVSIRDIWTHNFSNYQIQRRIRKKISMSSCQVSFRVVKTVFCGFL